MLAWLRSVPAAIASPPRRRRLLMVGAAACQARRRQALRRRYADRGARPRRWSDQGRPVVGVYALPTSLSDRFARAMRIPSVRARSPRSISELPGQSEGRPTFKARRAARSQPTGGAQGCRRAPPGRALENLADNIAAVERCRIGDHDQKQRGLGPFLRTDHKGFCKPPAEFDKSAALAEPGATPPGCRHVAVTPVPSSRRANSRVNRMLHSLERP